ncbi:MAG: 8-oxo-dGDP phosphatase [Frankiaceae bacterium]|nr:8-oxo-dGDP phosphatase [Frankiaceae bacterium]
MDFADTPAAYEVLQTSTVLHTGRVIDVRTDEVAFPGGGAAMRDVVVHPGAVGIVAVDDDERVLFVRQYRHPVRRLLWEPPAGLLDEVGENPLEGAKRELYEEAHHEAARWDVLVDAFTSPGMTDEAVRIYLARDLRPADRPRHDAEDEERDMPIGWMPLDQAADAVLAGRLHNPLAVMGILAAVRARQTGFTGLRPGDAPWPEMSDWPGSRAAGG